jgi:hypothetical protein
MPKKSAKKSKSSSSSASLVVQNVYNRLSQSTLGDWTRTWPDRLRVVLKTATTVTWASNPTVSLTYKANGGIAVGPQIDYAGGFNSNYPTSLAYLLGNNVANGTSTAPYYNARVVRSKIRVEVVSIISTPVRIIVFPSDDASQSGMAISTLMEQSRAVSTLSGNNTSGKPSTLETHIDTGLLFGHTEQQVLTEDNYSFGYNNDPARLLYWQVALRSVDGTTAGGAYITVTTWQEFVFSDLNNQTTVAPS